MTHSGPNYPSPGENEPSPEQLQLETLATSIKDMAMADHSSAVKVTTDANDVEVRCLSSEISFPEESLLYQLNSINQVAFNYVPAHTLIGPGGIEFTNPETFAMQYVTMKEIENIGEMGVSRTILLTRNETGLLQTMEPAEDWELTEEESTKSFFVNFIRTIGKMPGAYPFVERSTIESERQMLQSITNEAREFTPPPRTVSRYLRYSRGFLSSISMEVSSVDEFMESTEGQEASQANIERLFGMTELAGGDLEKDDGVTLANRIKQFMSLTPEQAAPLAAAYSEAAQQPEDDNWLASHSHLAGADLEKPAERMVVLTELSRDPAMPGIAYEIDNPAHQLEAQWELMRRVLRRTPSEIRTRPDLALDNRFHSLFEVNMKQEGIYDSVRPLHRQLLAQEAAIAIRAILHNETPPQDDTLGSQE